MSPPPTPINRQAAQIGTEYLGVAPPAAGVAAAAAAADHVHRVLASYSEITGFGKMWNYYTPANPDHPYPAWGYFFSKAPLAIPKLWTIELWATRNPAPANGPTACWGFGWSAADGDMPYSQTDLNLGTTPTNMMGVAYNGPIWGSQVQGAAGAIPSFIPGVNAAHIFCQMDESGTIYAGINGQLNGPVALPAGGLIYTNGFPIIVIGPNGYSDAEGWQIDEMRVSSTLRYPTSGTTYQVSADPFSPDNETMVLWHFDDVPYGQFMKSPGNGKGVWVLGPTTEDATVNAVQGIFAINDVTGQGTNSASVEAYNGENSNVTAGSGTGSAPNVQSIQGQTGNFLLVDSGGNPLDVSAPEGVQQIEVVGHLIGSPEYWY